MVFGKNINKQHKLCAINDERRNYINISLDCIDMLCYITRTSYIYMLAQEDSDIEKHAMGAILMTVCILMNMNTLITFS